MPIGPFDPIPGAEAVGPVHTSSREVKARKEARAAGYVPTGVEVAKELHQEEPDLDPEIERDPAVLAQEEEIRAYEQRKFAGVSGYKNRRVAMEDSYRFDYYVGKAILRGTVKITVSRKSPSPDDVGAIDCSSERIDCWERFAAIVRDRFWDGRESIFYWAARVNGTPLTTGYLRCGYSEARIKQWDRRMAEEEGLYEEAEESEAAVATGKQRFCSDCGTAGAPGAVFCAGCGRKQAASPQPPLQASAPGPRYPTGPNGEVFVEGHGWVMPRGSAAQGPAVSSGQHEMLAIIREQNERIAQILGGAATPEPQTPVGPKGEVFVKGYGWLPPPGSQAAPASPPTPPVEPKNIIRVNGTRGVLVEGEFFPEADLAKKPEAAEGSAMAQAVAIFEKAEAERVAFENAKRKAQGLPPLVSEAEKKAAEEKAAEIVVPEGMINLNGLIVPTKLVEENPFLAMLAGNVKDLGAGAQVAWHEIKALLQGEKEDEEKREGARLKAAQEELAMKKKANEEEEKTLRLRAERLEIQKAEYRHQQEKERRNPAVATAPVAPPAPAPPKPLPEAPPPLPVAETGPAGPSPVGSAELAHEDPDDRPLRVPRRRVVAVGEGERSQN